MQDNQCPVALPHRGPTDGTLGQDVLYVSLGHLQRKGDNATPHLVVRSK